MSFEFPQEYAPSTRPSAEEELAVAYAIHYSAQASPEFRQHVKVETLPLAKRISNLAMRGLENVLR